MSNQGAPHVVFQHEGTLFRARFFFAHEGQPLSGRPISGQSFPLEPCPLRKLPKGRVRRPGEGLYDVPGLQGWVLVIGRTSVAKVLRFLFDGGPAGQVNDYLARDLLDRPATD